MSEKLMSIREKILENTKTAMKEKNQLCLDTLRVLSSAIKNQEIQLRPEPISEADIFGVIKKLVNQRQESIDMFKKGGREDLAEKESKEKAILESYLPVEPTKEELIVIVDQTIQALSATSIKQMSWVMKEISRRTNGLANNKLASELVREKLS